MSQRLRRDSAVMPLPVNHAGAGGIARTAGARFAGAQLKSHLSPALAFARRLRLELGGPCIDPGVDHAGGLTFGLALDLVCRVAACGVHDPVRRTEIGTHEWILG